MQISGCRIHIWMILFFYEPNLCELSGLCLNLKLAHKFCKFENLFDYEFLQYDSATDFHVKMKLFLDIENMHILVVPRNFHERCLCVFWDFPNWWIFCFHNIHKYNLHEPLPNGYPVDLLCCNFFHNIHNYNGHICGIFFCDALDLAHEPKLSHIHHI